MVATVAADHVAVLLLARQKYIWQKYIWLTVLIVQGADLGIFADLEGGQQLAVAVVKVEHGYVAPAVGVDVGGRGLLCLHPLHGAVDLLQHLLRALLAVHRQLQGGGVVHLHLGHSSRADVLD